MKIEYFPETDSLYIDLAERVAADAIEISEGIVLDVDEEGRAAGLDIDQASKHLDLRKINLKSLPFAVEQVA